MQYEKTKPEDPSTELTKREYFAAMALQGMLAGNPSVGLTKTDIQYGAETSVLMADALIKALNEEA